MGTQVTAALKSDTKPNYTVATVVAASVAIVDEEFAIWAGDTIASQLEAYNGLLQCSQALREAGWLNPTTLQFASAAYNTVTGVLTLDLDGALPTLAETDVCVLQGLDFAYDHESNSAHVRRMQESWLEGAAKAA
jgi:hypothetical protein